MSNQHIVQRPEGWAVRGEGNQKTHHTTKTNKKLLKPQDK